MATWYEVPNWRRFQHYRKRNPPWVKLHRTLLDDPDYWALPDRAGRALIAIWMVAPDHDGRFDSDVLAWRLRRSQADVLEDLDILATAGFVRPCDAASIALANGKQDASDLLMQRRDRDREEKKVASLETGKAHLDELRRVLKPSIAR